MSDPLRIAIIGLDSSHAVEYPRRMQAPDCAEALRVPGLRAVSCLRFPSPFQPESGQDTRQAQLVAWGVRVASDVADAAKDADAIMLIINDPALHQTWFNQVAVQGKPVFVDKPLAHSARAGSEMIALAAQHGIRMCSSSPLRSDAALARACVAVPRPTQASVYGPLGRAPAGSSVIWYGVHAVEMLNRAMGLGAVAVTARRDGSGATVLVDYVDGRRGVVELTDAVGIYGGTLRNATTAAPFAAESGAFYTAQLHEISRFFRGGAPTASTDDALEVMSILDAAQRSIDGGRTEPVQH
jgi:predicted dehydrogenase